MHSRLNIGCGRKPLAGWANVDLTTYPDVDYTSHDLTLLDVRTPEFSAWLARRFPVGEIRADQFLEHLSPAEGQAWLRLCCEALRPVGRLWLSVPDWAAHVADYAERKQRVPSDQLYLAGPHRPEVNLMLRILYDWGHRTVYDQEILRTTVEAAGFRVMELTRPDGANVVCSAMPGDFVLHTPGVADRV